MTWEEWCKETELEPFIVKLPTGEVRSRWQFSRRKSALKYFEEAQENRVENLVCVPIPESERGSIPAESIKGWYQVYVSKPERGLLD